MPRVAAIDCGTNSIRLLVADAAPAAPPGAGTAPGGQGGQRLTDVHRETRIVRLGQGVDATGRFLPEAIERTRLALADYTDILRSTGAERVRMVATSATRDAGNRDEFFDMVRGTLGHEAEVISGDTEARLSFTGAVGDLPAQDGPFVVVDVGGGSTEVVVGTRDAQSGAVQVNAARSVDIGCVRITERCLRSDPPTDAERAAATELARGILAEAFDTVPVADARTWVGVAGTVTTLSAVSQDLPKYDETKTHLSRLDLPELHRVADELLSRSRERRMEFGAMHPGRVDVIGGGSLIVAVLAEELATRAGITELVVSEHDILDGIALSLL